MADRKAHRARATPAAEVVELASEYLEGAMTPEQRTRVRAAPESSATAARPSSSRSGTTAAMARSPVGGGDPRRDAGQAPRGLPGLERENEGVQVPHRSTASACSAASRGRCSDSGSRARGSSPRSIPAAPASTRAATTDLPYWVAPALYEIELDGLVAEQAIKVVAPRGRLRPTGQRLERHDAGGVRANVLRTGARARRGCAATDSTAGRHLRRSRSPSRRGSASSRRRIAEQLGGVEAYLEERERQSEWLVEHLDARLIRRVHEAPLLALRSHSVSAEQLVVRSRAATRLRRTKGEST